MSINLNPVVLANAFTLDLQGIPFNTIAWLEFLNESPQTLTMQIGGMNIQIPAWYDYPIEIHRSQSNQWIALNGCAEPVSIAPLLIPNALSSSLSNTLLVTVYQKGQYPAIQTPQPLFRQGWIPNTVNATGGIATSLQNDGNPAATNIVEATPFGGISSDVLIDNLGNAYLNGNVQIHGGIIANLITAETGNDIGFHAETAQKIVDTINGVNIAQSSVNGFKVLTQTLSLPFGLGITGFTWFGPFSVGTVQATFNHNLGVIPKVVLTVLDGTSSTSAIIKVDYSTLTSTQFKATGSLAGLTFYGIAIGSV